MSSLQSHKDDKDTELSEQGSSENNRSKEINDEENVLTTEEQNENKIAGNSQQPQSVLKDMNASVTLPSADNKSEENKDDPATATHPIEEVDSRLPGGSTTTKSTTRRILLKRRSSRISNQITVGTRNVSEEVDSSQPRSSKRRTPKKQVALFLESDLPRKK